MASRYDNRKEEFAKYTKDEIVDAIVHQLDGFNRVTLLRYLYSKKEKDNELKYKAVKIQLDKAEIELAAYKKKLIDKYGINGKIDNLLKQVPIPELQKYVELQEKVDKIDKELEKYLEIR